MSAAQNKGMLYSYDFGRELVFLDIPIKYLAISGLDVPKRHN